MFSASRLIRITHYSSSNVGFRNGSGIRFHQVPAAGSSANKGNIDKMENSQDPKTTNKKGDVMSHSFGEGYATRSDEEGFGGTNAGNQSLPKGEEEKIVHGNSPGTYT